MNDLKKYFISNNIDILEMLREELTANIMSLHSKLKWLRLRTKLHLNPAHGICGSINFDASTIISKLFSSWPEFSGEIAYPVPSPDFPLLPDSAGVCFHDSFLAGTLWRGEYGNSRKRLLDFLIEQTTPVNRDTIITPIIEEFRCKWMDKTSV